MKKLTEFSRRGQQNTRYPFREMSEQKGVVWELAQGEDFTSTFEAARRAAHLWAQRHKPRLKAVTSVVKEKGVIEIMFTDPE